MCGRAAQTQAAVGAAAASLGIAAPSVSASAPETAAATAAPEKKKNDETIPTSRSSYEWRDNYNMSPGMDAMVFCKDDNNGGVVRAERKIWGLVPRSGTQQSPLATGMNQHFSNLMFNARSDTLYSKPTFSRLAQTGKTCLVALDGFFEWKAGVVGNKASKKQPYFVYRKTSEQGSQGQGQEQEQQQQRRPYLLLAGLWTSVATGRPDEPTLDTFTVLTTEACKPLQWLHSRQPVFVWDDNLAMEWLLRPTQKVHQQLDEAAVGTSPDMLAWHAVTPEMSSTKFRSKDSILALPQMKTVKSFFGVAAKKKELSPKPDGKKAASKIAVSPEKRLGSTSSNTLSSPPNKRSKLSLPPSRKSKMSTPAKKGTLESFFSPKSSTKK
jgi:putative SOS response-associated peptidase YedK